MAADPMINRADEPTDGPVSYYVWHSTRTNYDMQTHRVIMQWAGHRLEDVVALDFLATDDEPEDPLGYLVAPRQDWQSLHMGLVFAGIICASRLHRYRCIYATRLDGDPVAHGIHNTDYVTDHEHAHNGYRISGR